MKKLAILILFPTIIAIAAIAFFIGYKYNDSKSDDDDNTKSSQVETKITTFEECAKANYPVAESYPRQCRTPDGKMFTEIIATDPIVEEAVEETSISIYLYDPALQNTAPYDNFVRAVSRSTSREDIATFAIEEIIKGPTNAEKALGLSSTFDENTSIWFISKSTCDGKDFRISIANEVATVQFCRDIMVAGDMSGAIIKQQIEKTLMQFSTIKEVIILDSTGHCFDDMSGLDLCLN